MNRSLRKLLRRFGYDLAKFTPGAHPLARKKQLLESYGIDTVLDVGANAGQFGRQLRRDLGYARRIISFEPLDSAFAQLAARARRRSVAGFQFRDRRRRGEARDQRRRELPEQLAARDAAVASRPYEGELLLNEMCALLSGRGYTLVALESGFSDPVSGQLLQVDGIFHRL